jgi:tetratricopeptide (TPR) repeat protein
MEEVALNELDSRLHKQIENVRKALDKNPSYSVDVMTNIVDRHPQCLEARKMLRLAQQRASSGKLKVLKSMFSKVSCAFHGIGSAEKVKKDPTAALSAAEKLLNSNPSNVSAHKVIGIAAEALELHETAAFAFEEIYKIEPSNLENVKALMSAYIRIGKNDEAVHVGDQANKGNATDEAIQSLIRKASVEQSIKKGKWEASERFRDKLKDEGEAHKLEQASKARTSDSEIHSMIEAAKKAVTEQPDNLNLYREISNNYRKLKELDKALEWIAKARKLEAGSVDVNLERLESTLKLEKMRQVIVSKEKELEDDSENAELKSALETFQKEEDSFLLVQAEDFVKRYPNEFSYRYELGELYYKKGEADKAIRELQLAQRSSKVRVSTLILLGKVYKSKRFFDLAIEQFDAVKSEIPGPTEQKKDVLYELGSCYELQGEAEKAIIEYKALYSMDISYRDVSSKIDDFYAQE